MGININRHAGRPTNRQTDRRNTCSCVSAYIQTQITLIDSSVGDVINITTIDFISKDTFLVPNIALADLGNQVRFSIPLHENSNPESPERPASVLSSALSRLPTRKEKKLENNERANASRNQWRAEGKTTGGGTGYPSGICNGAGYLIQKLALIDSCGSGWTPKINKFARGIHLN